MIIFRGDCAALRNLGQERLQLWCCRAVLFRFADDYQQHELSATYRPNFNHSMPYTHFNMCLVCTFADVASFVPLGRVPENRPRMEMSCHRVDYHRYVVRILLRLQLSDDH